MCVVYVCVRVSECVVYVCVSVCVCVCVWFVMRNAASGGDVCGR